MKIEDILARASVIPVLDFSEVAFAAPLALALKRGGLHVIEVTMRSADAPQILRAIKDAAPDLIVGMGTIRRDADIAAALGCGADFLVSPGAGPSLLKALASCNAPVLPGVTTPSEVITALEAGCLVQKFFPAEPAGGISFLKSLMGPFPEVSFCPTGGISADKARDYLMLPNVVCVGGSWIASRDLISGNDWTAISANARRAAEMKFS